VYVLPSTSSRTGSGAAGFTGVEAAAVAGAEVVPAGGAVFLVVAATVTGAEFAAFEGVELATGLVATGAGFSVFDVAGADEAGDSVLTGFAGAGAFSTAGSVFFSASNFLGGSAMLIETTWSRCTIAKP